MYVTACSGSLRFPFAKEGMDRRPCQPLAWVESNQQRREVGGRPELATSKERRAEVADKRSLKLVVGAGQVYRPVHVQQWDNLSKNASIYLKCCVTCQARTFL